METATASFYNSFFSLSFWTGKTGEVVTLPLIPLLLISIIVILLMGGVAFHALATSRHIRALNNTLTATQLALAKEQKVSAFGALAAAAAHELGSPLSTISLAAKDILSSLASNSPLKEDVDLIISQGERCRNILLDLSHYMREDPDQPEKALPLSALIEQAANPHKLPHIQFSIDKKTPDPEPRFSVTPDLVHGLGNILQNAFQFATSRVCVTLKWDKNSIEAIIQDDGRGYPPELLPRIGVPKPAGLKDTSRKGAYQGLGLGLFIAKTLLSQRQAEVHFYNDGGACCLIKWPTSIQVMDS